MLLLPCPQVDRAHLQYIHVPLSDAGELWHGEAGCCARDGAGGNLEHLFSRSVLWLPGPSSSDVHGSAFGLLGSEQATVLAMQMDLYKVFTFGIKHYLQGSNSTHQLIFLQ